MQLKIFSDLCYAPSEAFLVPMLSPFLERSDLLESDASINIQYGRFSQYEKIAHSLFQLVNIDAADIVLFPSAWEISRNLQGRQLLEELANKANSLKKPLVVFVGGDLPVKLPIQNVFIFHTSLYRFERSSKSFGMPAFIDDIYKKSSFQSFVRTKSCKPKVGFCGISPPINMKFGKQKIKETVRSLLNSFRISPFTTYQAGHSQRTKALNYCLRSSLIETNFIIQGYSPMTWAYGYLMSTDKSTLEEHRQNYLKNILDSDYVICARGWGNYSIRLYETLCLGRIPVLIDTECVLPYDFSINWKDYCIWINEQETHLIGEKIADFHNRISSRQFIELQVECRKLWENWLSPEGFFSNFYRHFTEVEHNPVKTDY